MDFFDSEFYPMVLAGRTGDESPKERVEADSFITTVVEADSLITTVIDEESLITQIVEGDSLVIP